jgi:predicted nucleic acid-binding protein
MTAAGRGARYVIDATTALKLLVHDPLSERAQALFNLLNGEPPAEFFVPDLFFIECANVLWKYMRWGGLSLEVARADLTDLASLDLDITSTADLMDAAVVLAQRHLISAYDACYLALADHYQATLVTADKKLVQVRPGILWLGDFRVEPTS